jgi:class 3 adenylate cyclase
MVELPGGTADPEDAATRNRAFRDYVRARIASHGGIVSAHAGSASAAIFGAPVAHDDDAVRAVSAARAGISNWPEP